MAFLNQKLLHFILIILLCKNLVQSDEELPDYVYDETTTRPLVPHLSMPGYELDSEPNGYFLRLQAPEFERLDSVYFDGLDTPKQIQTAWGSLNQLFPKESYHLDIRYTADQNGYVAKYQIVHHPSGSSSPRPPCPFIPFYSISELGLKAAAG